MYRNVINDLAAWYEERRRRILYIKGARGVGKTWSIKDFSTTFFEHTVYIDVSCSPDFLNVIAGIVYIPDSTGTRSNIGIIPMEARVAAMETLLAEQFGELDYDRTLLIFDEVQNIDGCSEFFYEFAKRHRSYPICLIASTMCITEFEYHHADVFNIIRIRPMSFEEYMLANEAHPLLAAIEQQKNSPLTSLEKDTVCQMLKEYLIIGGMPEIIKTFIENKDYAEVRSKQLAMLEDYRQMIRDSFPYAMAQRVKRIWESIPKQLTHDNKKFMYRFVEENARAREYADAVQNLCNLGLIRKLPRLLAGELPLESHADYNSFELFLIDHGLLRALYGEPADESLSLQDIFAEQNGAVAEQFIFQELSSKMGYLYYWISGATARVSFVYEGDEHPIPVDIRFIKNKRAQNIKTFRAKIPNTDISLQISLDQVTLDNKILNVPAYGLWNM